MQAARVMSLDPRSRMSDNVSDILEKIVAQIFRQPARGRLYFRDHMLRHPIGKRETAFFERCVHVSLAIGVSRGTAPGCWDPIHRTANNSWFSSETV